MEGDCPSSELLKALYDLQIGTFFDGIISSLMVFLLVTKVPPRAPHPWGQQN